MSGNQKGENERGRKLEKQIKKRRTATKIKMKAVSDEGFDNSRTVM